MHHNVQKAKNWNSEQPQEEHFFNEKGKDRETGYVSKFGTNNRWFPNIHQANNYANGYQNGIRLDENKMTLCGCCGVAMGVGMQCDCKLKNDSYRETHKTSQP